MCNGIGCSLDIKINESKTVQTVFKTKKDKDWICQQFILNGNAIAYCKNYKYLGHIVNASLEDNEDIQSHMRKIYARGNKLINTFKHCSDNVKVTLFKTFVSNFYSLLPIYGVITI